MMGLEDLLGASLDRELVTNNRRETAIRISYHQQGQGMIWFLAFRVLL